MSGKITIHEIDEKSDYLDLVMELGDENSKTLGFFSRGAFTDAARKRNILVAQDSDGDFAGYLLYATNTRRQVYIVHLCIKPSKRTLGVARSLRDSLKEKTFSHYDGIRVHCRDDYGLSNFWSKLGFSPQSKKRGRGKEQKPITVWWLNYGHPNLFTFTDTQRLSRKLHITIDANVLIDLDAPSTAEEAFESKMLIDWFADEIEICLTEEIRVEIDRCADKSKRSASSKRLKQFKVVPDNFPLFEKNYSLLRPLFSENLTDNDESDLRHLSRTITAGINLFVTRDENLLKKSDATEDRVGLVILTPSRLVLYMDEMMRQTDYQPARVSGSGIHQKRVSHNQIDELYNYFLPTTKGAKSEFKQLITQCIVDKKEIQITLHDAQPITLFAYSVSGTILDLSIVRVYERSAVSGTVIRHKLMELILNGIQSPISIIKVSEPYISEIVKNAFSDCGFINALSNWFKINLNGLYTQDSLSLAFSKIKKSSSIDFYIKDTLGKNLEILSSVREPQVLIESERLFFPLKLVDLDIPCFIVPITPGWAMQLFDHGLARQDLVGGREDRLLLNFENAYYRSAHSKILTAPARILWYVSDSKTGTQGVKAIRSASFLDEVVIDKPKKLYKKYRRLGIYEWKDVFSIAKNDLDKNIMGFKFRQTEIFDNPVTYTTLQSIWHSEKSTTFTVQSPLKIDSTQFFRIYKLGFPSSSQSHELVEE
jgi:hypothetical protein